MAHNKKLRYVYIYKNLLKTKLARTYRKRSLPTNSKIAYKNIAAQRRVADGSAKKKKKKFPNNFTIICSFLNLYFSSSTSWNYL